MSHEAGGEGEEASAVPPPPDAHAQGELLFLRCRTPTNFLCPCGAVARRLQRLGIPHRTERLPYRRSQRAEVEELTGQRRIPLIVDGDEVIYDSRRILQYLEWRHGKPGEEPAGAPGAEGG